MTELNIIAHIKTDFPSKFGIPRQSGLVEQLHAAVIFEPEYRSAEAVRGLEEFSHIWILWGFSQAKQEDWSPTVRPPRLGGNARMGVFATRSPYRPNKIALSSVKLEGIDKAAENGPLIYVSGADMLDGTPIYDIKPYLPFTDCHPEAATGFSATPSPLLDVRMGRESLRLVNKEEEAALRALLAQDPRPGYHADAERIYGMEYKNFEVKFCVDGNTLEVLSILKR